MIRWLGQLAMFAVVGFALAQMFQPRVAPEPLNLALWLVGGALVHDLLLLPGYSAVDSGLRRFLPAGALNFVRVPLAIAGLTFLLFIGLILDRQPGNYERALGHPPPDFLGRWLLFCGALFAGSAVLYAARRLTGGRSAAARRSAP
ncbi:MAG: hypothetical protein JHC95_00635 [Solirubrobacteraceae bacterium]|nr:hypothetical protein [Solirubrobacteraceae bacterium]